MYAVRSRVCDYMSECSVIIMGDRVVYVRTVGTCSILRWCNIHPETCEANLRDDLAHGYNGYGPALPTVLSADGSAERAVGREGGR